MHTITIPFPFHEFVLLTLGFLAIYIVARALWRIIPIVGG